MINYLEKFAETNDGMVVCNWDRGKGKTKAIVDKIIYDIIKEDTDFIIISPNWQINKSMIIDILKDEDPKYTSFGVVSLKINEENIAIISNVYEYGRSNKPSKNVEKRIFFANTLDSPKLRGIKPKHIFMDNINPCSVDINIINSFNPKGVFIMTTDKNFKYIEDDSKTISNSEWIDGEIEKLKLEYSRLSNEAISCNKNNTITRQSILDMIINLKSLKGK